MRPHVAVVAAAVLVAAFGARAQPAPEPTPPPAPPATETPPPTTPPPATTTTTPPATTPPLATPPATKPAPGPAADGRVKVIVLDLKGASLSTAEASALTSLVTVSLSEFTAFEVVSGADVREMMALEGEKAQLGCEESMSCIAEIAGALGARMVAFGQIEKLGSRYIMSVNLQDTKAGRSVGRIALQGDSLDAVAAAVPDAVHKVALAFLKSESLPTTTTSAQLEAPQLPSKTAPPTDGGHGWLKWTGGIVAGSSVTLLGVGTVGLMSFAASQGAPGEIVSALQSPVIGPFVLASTLSSCSQDNGSTGTDGSTPPVSSGNGGGLSQGLIAGAANNSGSNCGDFVGLAYVMAGVEVIVAIAGVAGTIGFAYANLADAPPVGTAGLAWRWGLIGGGVAALAGGVAMDNFSPSSKDRTLDFVDFVPATLEVLGATAIIVGLTTNPFPDDAAGAKTAASVNTNAE